VTNKEENEKSHFRKDNVEKLEECSVGKIKIFNFIMNTLYSDFPKIFKKRIAIFFHVLTN